MKLKVMISAPYMQPVINRFRNIFESHDIELIIPPVKERLEEADLLQVINDIDGVICGDDLFTDKVLQSALKLKVISKWGTGIDSINIDSCHKLNISIYNIPNAFSEPVADSVLGYILCYARRLLSMNKNMHNGNWHKIQGIALQECTLGIIGVGNIGKAVARRAFAFGMKLIGNDPKMMPSDFLSKIPIQMLPK